MEQIFSKINPQTLLHIVTRKQDMTKERQDIVPEDNFIQCSMLNMKKDKTFRPHKHIWKDRCRAIIAQESWIVIQGSVECHFYDLDNTLLTKVVLQPGDASFTLQGGHNYRILEEDTLVYEYKTGPYEGQYLDKVFLDAE